ncbi:FAD-binding oxidoreductase [Salinithrix halophila]|uniref:FAD-binding oxidoreductase n=1 Tax=Salinithrix halophila TaxID=1485204 RepID=A0ABV8JBZ2_9BACL
MDKDGSSQALQNEMEVMGMLLTELETVFPGLSISGGGGPHPLGNCGDQVVVPETEDQIAKILRHADHRGWKVTITGGGSKRGFGGLRKRYDLELSLAAYKGVVEHRAGDMTVTARAGTTISELASYLSKEGQMLPVDPRWPGTATLGGVVAANDSGPKRLRYGGVRDFVLGIRVIRADGCIIRTGGKVVKNVAGYDMNKLFVGSMGTLGVMTELTVKLRPVPKEESLVIVLFRKGAEDEIQPWVRAIQSATLEPCILELLNPALAEKMTGSPRYGLAIAWEDRKEAVEAQEKWLRSHCPAGAHLAFYRRAEAKARWEEWSRLPPNGVDAERGSETVSVKVGTRNTDVAACVRFATGRADDEGLRVLAHGGAGHGITRVYADGPPSQVVGYLADLRTFAIGRGGYAVVDHMPFSMRKRFDAWGDRIAPLPLMEGIKHSFDPNRTLNDQRFVGGL